MTDHRSGQRKGFLTTLLLSGLALVGCKLADLQPETLKNAEEAAELNAKARQVYGAALEQMGGLERFKRYKTKTLTGIDQWNSAFVRWFTPATESEQRFSATLSRDKDEIVFRFLNGSRKDEIIGVEAGSTFEERDEKRIYGNAASIRLYLVPLRDYLEWPFTLFDSPVLLYGGSRTISDGAYDVVFASTGRVGPSKRHDQYLIYINRESGLVDYIEFTLRELMASYKGALHYDDFRQVEGLSIPFRIGVSGSVEDNDFVHVFYYEDMRFSKSS